MYNTKTRQAHSNNSLPFLALAACMLSYAAEVTPHYVHSQPCYIQLPLADSLSNLRFGHL